MQNLIFTLDYEIHGNGDGSPYNLMVEPTYRLMDLLEKYDAKLTIFADIAEILCFKRYYEETKDDKFCYLDIIKQLQDAVKRGHDVQLHTHSSYFKAEYNGTRWEQYIEEYNMAALPYERIDEMIKQSVGFLNEILKPIKPDYECIAFRAANWSMMPTPNIYKALVNNGIRIDTSVYKGGCQGGNVSYDYRDVYSNIESYPASSENINLFDVEGKITEYPIYTLMKPFWYFISPIRVFRMIRAKFHKHRKNQVATEMSGQANKNDNRKLSVKSFFRLSPWKYDFNQATSRQMIKTLKNILKKTDLKKDLNIVLIGHSKSFLKYNEKTLEAFLRFAARQKQVNFKVFE